MEDYSFFQPIVINEVFCTLLTDDKLGHYQKLQLERVERKNNRLYGSLIRLSSPFLEPCIEINCFEITVKGVEFFQVLVRKLLRCNEWYPVALYRPLLEAS